MKKGRIKLQLFANKNEVKRYYSLYKQEKSANIYIYGDITSYPWLEEDTSSYNLSKEIQKLEDVDNINVYINSYGGEVAEGLAIYNSLKRHKAKITTIVDGFACSMASVIFAAGDERIMNNTSLLMIHNAWSFGSGDSNEFKKKAEDLEKITKASINAYMSIINIDEVTLKGMMDKETWLSGEESLNIGFATKVSESDDNKVASQSTRQAMMNKVLNEPKSIVQVTTPKIVLDDEIDIDVFVQKITEGLKETLQGEEPQQIENKPLSMMQALFSTKGDN